MICGTERIHGTYSCFGLNNPLIRIAKFYFEAFEAWPQTPCERVAPVAGQFLSFATETTCPDSNDLEDLKRVNPENNPLLFEAHYSSRRAVWNGSQLGIEECPYQGRRFTSPLNCDGSTKENIRSDRSFCLDYRILGLGCKGAMRELRA
jgi:hypothetical protein